jgi:hypothetical protein
MWCDSLAWRREFAVDTILDDFAFPEREQFLMAYVRSSLGGGVVRGVAVRLAAGRKRPLRALGGLPPSSARR